MHNTEDDILIAKFMGYTISKTGRFEKTWDYIDGEGHTHNQTASHKTIAYSSSWSSLMRVVEVIESICEDGLNWTYCVTIERGYCCISRHGEIPIMETDGEDKLKVTYFTIVKFIKWYNTNK